METLTLIRPVLVKVKVTDSHKNVMVAELQEELKRVELELRHLDFQEKRLVSELEKKNPQGIPAVRHSLEEERRKRLESRKRLADRIRETGQLALGSEVIYSRMESLVEVNVGDEWSRITGAVIILEDGLVKEIRQGGA